jgi:hypothetical protein
VYFGATGINCASFDDFCFDFRTVPTVWNFFALFNTTVYATVNVHFPFRFNQCYVKL